MSTSPDVCRSPSAPVPYPVWGKADDKENYSPDVRSNGCVIKRRDSRFTTTYGDEPGTGLGVKSNTVGSKVEPVTSSRIVRANGIPVQRHGDRCTLNHGNCPGEYLHVKSTATHDAPDGRDQMPWYKKAVGLDGGEARAGRPGHRRVRRRARDLMRYRYDGRGNLVAAEAAHGPSRYYEHDAHDRRIAWTDGATTWGRRAYDGQGRVVRIESRGADGEPAPYDGDTFAYDPENRRTLYTPGRHPEERRWYVYDDDGLVVAMEDARGNVVRQVWNAAGEKRAEIDAEGRRTSYRYDEYGSLAAITDPSGRETRAYHDADGNLELAFDALGQSWRYEYDRERNLVSVTDPLDYRTDITNDARGRPTGLMRHNGLIENRTYDAQGRLAAIRDYRGESTRFERDGFGRIVTVRDPLGAATTFAYEEGKGLDFWTPTTITRPDGVTSRRSVDRAGAKAVVTDGEGRRVVYRTGPHDLLAEIEDPMGSRLRFSYDGLKRLERVENQLGRLWRFERDGAGNIVAETDFDGLRTAYAYDRSGRLTERTAADGTRTRYDWDPSGLLLREAVQPPDGGEPSVTRYGYDQAGRLGVTLSDEGERPWRPRSPRPSSKARSCLALFPIPKSSD